MGRRYIRNVENISVTRISEVRRTTGWKYELIFSEFMCGNAE